MLLLYLSLILNQGILSKNYFHYSYFRKYIYNILLILCRMILKVNGIIIYGVLTFFLSLLLYPLYIKFLHYINAGKTLRDDDVS